MGCLREEEKVFGPVGPLLAGVIRLGTCCRALRLLLLMPSRSGLSFFFFLTVTTLWWC